MKSCGNCKKQQMCGMTEKINAAGSNVQFDQAGIKPVKIFEAMAEQCKFYEKE